MENLNPKLLTREIEKIWFFEIKQILEEIKNIFFSEKSKFKIENLEVKNYISSLNSSIEEILKHSNKNSKTNFSKIHLQENKDYIDCEHLSFFEQKLYEIVRYWDIIENLGSLEEEAKEENMDFIDYLNFIFDELSSEKLETQKTEAIEKYIKNNWDPKNNSLSIDKRKELINSIKNIKDEYEKRIKLTSLLDTIRRLKNTFLNLLNENNNKEKNNPPTVEKKKIEVSGTIKQVEVPQVLATTRPIEKKEEKKDFFKELEQAFAAQDYDKYFDLLFNNKDKTNDDVFKLNQLEKIVKIREISIEKKRELLKSLEWKFKVWTNYFDRLWEIIEKIHDRNSKNKIKKSAEEHSKKLDESKWKKEKNGVELEPTNIQKDDKVIYVEKAPETIVEETPIAAEEVKEEIIQNKNEEIPKEKKDEEQNTQKESRESKSPKSLKEIHKNAILENRESLEQKTKSEIEQALRDLNYKKLFEILEKNKNDWELIWETWVVNVIIYRKSFIEFSLKITDKRVKKSKIFQEFLENYL